MRACIIKSFILIILINVLPLTRHRTLFKREEHRTSSSETKENDNTFFLSLLSIAFEWQFRWMCWQCDFFKPFVVYVLKEFGVTNAGIKHFEWRMKIDVPWNHTFIKIVRFAMWSPNLLDGHREQINKTKRKNRIHCARHVC